MLLVRAIAIQFGRNEPRAAVLAAWLLALGVGAADELTQSFAPLRTSDFADLRADAIGALLGVLIGAWGYLRSPRVESEPAGSEQPPVEAS